MATMQKQLLNYFKASFPGIAIETTEEARAMHDIVEAAKELKRAVVTWSATEGLREVRPRPTPDKQSLVKDSKDIVTAAEYRRADGNVVIVFRDAHTWPFDRDPILARTFRDLLTTGPENGTTVVFLSPSFRPHPTFEKLVTVLDYGLPSADDLRRAADGIAESAQIAGAEIDEDVIRALGGLSTAEAENALALSLVETTVEEEKKPGFFSPAVVYREKVKAVRRSGLLDIIEADPRGLEAVGGLEGLKEWILKRRRAYSPEATKFGLPMPKGIMLIGVPGTGKSLSAKAIGTALGIPTVRLDVGTLFNSLVGESEARTRDALKLAEAMAPCVLWVDEIDKGLAGADGGSNDSGVTRRVFGSIISWMQERKRPVFLVATANSVTALPPELLRKGRLDELFFVDLPDAEDRKSIFEIHLAKRGRDVANFDLGVLAEVSNNFTGSEIEAVIDEALFAAFDAEEELSMGHICDAARHLVPLAQTAETQLAALREWAENCARKAAKARDAAPLAKKRNLREISK